MSRINRVKRIKAKEAPQPLVKWTDAKLEREYARLEGLPSTWDTFKDRVDIAHEQDRRQYGERDSSAVQETTKKETIHAI